MENIDKPEVIPLDYIRGLIVAQRGRCAISGEKLNPSDVNADHIDPLSRADLKSDSGRKNIWLVDKRVNALKGTMSYEELVQIAKTILKHESETRVLFEKVRGGGISPISKADFDKWVTENCDEAGIVKD
ncbi:MAG: hypothetical protein Q7R35_08515 [Elusimicrobiota bacterium]|nr:hypothetical protein [Elusimicrobiota bacterium]